eukprot:3252251-Pleurochrysis_carterae.AAC.1
MAALVFATPREGARLLTASKSLVFSAPRGFSLLRLFSRLLAGFQKAAQRAHVPVAPRSPSSIFYFRPITVSMHALLRLTLLNEPYNGDPAQVPDAASSETLVRGMIRTVSRPTLPRKRRRASLPH